MQPVNDCHPSPPKALSLRFPPLENVLRRRFQPQPGTPPVESRRAPSPGAVTLTVVAGPHFGREFPLENRDSFLVGRSPDCHFRVADDDPYFSDGHFLVEVNAPKCRVIDLASRSGIKVNGSKVECADLADGDEIRAGQTVFRVDVAAQSDDTQINLALPEWTSPGSPISAFPTVPGYVVEKELGRGSRGVVFRARRTSDGARVAIKMILPARGTSQQTIDRFLAELARLERVRHMNVVQYLASGVSGPAIYIVMEYVGGPNAERVADERGPIAARAAVYLMAQALSGLAHVHAAGFVHRELSPANLLLGKLGDKRIVKVADFGLARAFDEAKLRAMTIVGRGAQALAFTAPEQITHVRQAGPAADQYGAAATLYSLLTGKTPYDLPGETERAVALILGEEPVPVDRRKTDLPPGLTAVVARALARKAESRFPDLPAFRTALLACADA